MDFKFTESDNNNAYSCPVINYYARYFSRTETTVTVLKENSCGLYDYE